MVIFFVLAALALLLLGVGVFAGIELESRFTSSVITELEGKIKDLREHLRAETALTNKIAGQRDEADAKVNEIAMQRDYARTVVADMQRICDRAPCWGDVSEEGESE